MILRSLTVALAIAVAPTFGAIIQVADPSLLAPGPFIVHDFETSAGGPGATYSATDGVEQGTGNFGDARSGSSLTTVAFPRPITITFDNPVTAFGLWFGNDDLCCTTGFDANLDIFDAGGLVGTISVTANMNDTNDQFLGFNSTAEQVTSVTLRYGDGSNVGLFHAIDDVQFNDASVPEPSAMLLGAPGLLALWAIRRRRS